MKNTHVPDLSAPCEPQSGRDGVHTVPNQAPAGRNASAHNLTLLGLRSRPHWNASLSALLFVLATIFGFAIGSSQAQHWCEEDPILAIQYQSLVSGADGCPTMGASDDPARRNAHIPTGATPIKTVRLKFNVFSQDDGSDPAATPAAIAAQVTALNNHYRPARIQFTHTVATIRSTRFRVLDLGLLEDVEMKNAHADQPGLQHNIYVVDLPGGLLGRSTFPWWPVATAKQGGTLLDGSAIASYPSALTHELGHALGLWHTHHGVSEVESCSSCWERADGANTDRTGDLCSDTPPTPVNYSCAPPPGADSCSGQPWGRTAVENFMGYSLDCHTMFSSQQAGRMHAWIVEKLAGWLDAPIQPPARTIYVDRAYAGPNPNGSPSAPFPTIQQGFNAAQSGDVLKVRTGDYGVPLLAGKAVRFETENGPIRMNQVQAPPSPALVVQAGSDFEVSTGSYTSILATAQAVNTAAPTSWRWEKLSGPGRVFSQNHAAANYAFSVSSSGTYELRVTASNGSLTSSDTVRVTFREPVLFVDAGRNQEVPFPWTSSLAGSVLVDERPNPEATFRWRKISGPGALTFTAATSLATSVTPSMKGVYYIYLEAWYSGKYRADRVAIGFGQQLPTGVADQTDEETTVEPLLELTKIPSGSMELTILSPDGRPCMVQRSENLTDWNDWQAVSPVNGILSLTDNETLTASKKFYRLKVQ